MIEQVPARYRKRIQVDLSTGCWLWTGAKTKGHGCGKICGHTFYTHRLVFELLVGPVPDGMELHHKCRVKHCCNPDHLELLTRKEHIARHPTAWLTCKRGHKLTPENTYRYRNGRQCRQCRIQRSLEYQIGYRARKKVLCQKIPSQ